MVESQDHGQANNSAESTQQQSSTSTWQPKYIWRNTELDGVLPFSNFSSDVKMNSQQNKNQGKGKAKASQNDHTEVGLI